MLDNLPVLIQTVGLFGLFGIIFAETGLLIGFFLPGDSLLFTAGILASQNVFGIVPLMAGSFVAAVIGDSVGYSIGRRAGGALFNRPDSRFFKQEYVKKASAFYAKHGAKTIILARFVPIVRTFAPVLAGVGQMDYRTFLIYNILGGFLWAVGLPLTGYFLGSFIPDVDKYLLPIILVIVIASIAPAIKELWPTPMKKGRS